MKRKRLGCSFMLIILFFVLICIDTFAEEGSKEVPETLRPKLTSTPPVVDGILNDEAWNRPPDVDKPFVSYSPSFGEVFPEKTHEWRTGENFFWCPGFRR